MTACSSATTFSYSANAAANQRSASVAGSSVPRQANGCRASNSTCRGSSFFGNASRSIAANTSSVSSVLGGRTTDLTSINVQSCATSGWIDGCCSRSLSEGSQVRPSGGPNRAQLFKSRAIAAVVNLASQDGNPTSGGVEKASKPNASPICP